MERQAVRLTREELYEKMWSRPAISLAEEFGISGRGLGKLCSRFEIPVPPRGYWAKLAAGKHVTRIPLPNAKSEVPYEILFQPSPEPIATCYGSRLPETSTHHLNRSKELRDSNVQRLRQLRHSRERGAALAAKNLRQMALRKVRFQIESVQRSVLLKHELPQSPPEKSFLVHGGEVAKWRHRDVCNCKRFCVSVRAAVGAYSIWIPSNHS